MERESPLGPVQMLSIAFPGSQFKGEILPELERLKSESIVRIVDLLVIRKDSAGAVATLKASDLDWEEASDYGAYIGSLVGFGSGGHEGAERGSMHGAAELADGHFFDENDAFRLAETVPKGWSVAMLLLEHLWAIPLAQAVKRAEGFEVDNLWITVDELVRVGLHAE
jgi:uncharacterized membrane protein